MTMFWNLLAAKHLLFKELRDTFIWGFRNYFSFTSFSSDSNWNVQIILYYTGNIKLT